MNRKITESQRIWAAAKEEMAVALAALGYPGELSDVLASQLKSPRAMERMTAYLRGVRPRSLEMIMDETLAICQDVASWRSKKESEEAQAKYNAWLNSELRLQNLDQVE